MITSPLQTVPHLPVSFDTDLRNPLPTYHVSTSLERHPVPLRSQRVAVHPTGIAPVLLKTIPTRPIEVQPVAPVPFAGAIRLPYFVPPKQRVSTPGRWGRIQIATQDPLQGQDASRETCPEAFQDVREASYDATESCDEQIVFEVGHAHEVQLGGLEEGSSEIEHEGAVPNEDEREEWSESECEDSFPSDRVLGKEQAMLSMHRVPMMGVPHMVVGVPPIRTNASTIRRSKKARRPKKSSSARIW